MGLQASQMSKDDFLARIMKAGLEMPTGGVQSTDAFLQGIDHLGDVDSVDGQEEDQDGAV
jgi:hypothetical protein